MRKMCLALLFSLAAAGAGEAQTPSSSDATGGGLLPEPHLVEWAVKFGSRFEGDDQKTPQSGFYPQMGHMMTGAGWISAGPGYRRWFMDRHMLVDGSAAISWRAYKQAQARVEAVDLAGGRLAVGSRVRWEDFTQISYFGAGEGSSQGDRSQYRLKNTDLIGYATLQPNRWLAVDGEFGRMQSLRLSSAAGPFQRDYPDALVMFSEEPGVSERPDFLHGTAKVTADTRNYDSRPTSGGLYRASAATYSDRNYGQFSFQQYEVEGLQFLPVKGEMWTLALHGWGVFSDTSAGNDVPFYMLPSLGGKNTLRGYYDFRFHDRNSLVASAESRWALLRDVDVAAFFDAGNVAPRTGDLNLKKTSWGTGLRLHNRTATLARIDIAHGREGWRYYASLDDPFRLKRLMRRGPDVPFLP